MTAVAQGDLVDCSDPKLSVFVHDGGVLKDVTGSLEYVVLDVSSGSEVQVHPPSGRAAVDLADCPTGDRLGLGHYAAEWAVPAAENVGPHRVRWFLQLEPGAVEQSYREDFEVLPAGTDTTLPGYCTVAELRAEGVPDGSVSGGFSDAYLLERIALASEFIDDVTGRHFAPVAKTIEVDGRGGRILQLDEVVVAVASVEFEVSPFQPSSLQIDPDLLKVYNRHLRQNLRSPDDRNNPKIELFHASDDITNASPYVFTRLIFPLGQQNITVDGVFGYTDFSSLNTGGVTPRLLRRLCQLLVMRDIFRLTDGKRAGALNQYRLVSQRTRQQSVTYEGPSLSNRVGIFTGDPEIDLLLARFTRPPSLGAA